MIVLRTKAFTEPAKKKSGKVKEKVRSLGHKAVNAVVDNPIDTAAYVTGDLVLPGILAKKAASRWKGPKGKIAAGVLGAYAMSPIGLTSAGIALKNRAKKKKNNTRAEEK